MPEATADMNPKSEQAIRVIDNYDVDTVIYTDGSCKDGTEDGGAAAVITTGTARYPVVLETLQRKGSKYTCSFEEEKQAMILALMWTSKENNANNTVICTDSLSLLHNIESKGPDLRDIFELLTSIKGTVVFQWVPSHTNVPGNELADLAAKAATSLPTEGQLAISYGTAKALIERTIKDPAPRTI